MSNTAFTVISTTDAIESSDEAVGLEEGADVVEFLSRAIYTGWSISLI
jgi:hypothetical protein